MVQTYDFVIAGGGIVGVATAAELLRRQPKAKVILLEKEGSLAAHQTGHNSGVIHSGLYYRPGSLKAQTCVRGRDLLYAYCAEHGVKHERCGKLVVAVDEAELPMLATLKERGEANGLQGVEELDRAQMREREPAVEGVAGLLVPETGIVDFPGMTRALADEVRRLGGEVRLGTPVRWVRRSGRDLILQTSHDEIKVHNFVNCAGLHADRVARSCGIDPSVRIIPFRGEYYELSPTAAGKVKHLVYPVPDPRFPFLGVHFTRMVGGGVEAGPNAVLAFAREGYRKADISLGDLQETFTWPGFWHMAAKYWYTGMGEIHRSFSKQAFLKSLRRIIPELTAGDLLPGGSGVRAQAVDRSGKLVDDFVIEQAEGMVHVLNAPSPAATASLAIAEQIADRVMQA